MRRILSLALSLLTAIAWLSATPSAALAAGSGIVDSAHIFKSDTVDQAKDLIQRIEAIDHHDVHVETFSAIPDDQKATYSPDTKAKFFDDWAQRVGRENRVSGIVILICMDPGRVEIVVGNQTKQRAFPERDRSEVNSQFLAAFKVKNYDAGLLDGLRLIQSRMTANIGGSRSAAAPAAAQPGGSYGGSSGSTPLPAKSSGFSSIGSVVCLIVGAIIVLFLVVGLFNRNRGYSGGYGGGPPPGGYPPGYQGGGYQGGGYGGGGGGGGFGRGLLGGLLGGAVGAWGYDKLTHQNQGGNANAGYTPTPSDGGSPASNDVDTSYSGGGGDFDSSGGGSSDTSSSSGGDFGGGGGDFGGGGGGDSGGGGGGDSGGGGGDF